VFDGNKRIELLLTQRNEYYKKTNGFILSGLNIQSQLEDRLINTTSNFPEYPALRTTDFETGMLQARPLLSFSVTHCGHFTRMKIRLEKPLIFNRKLFLDFRYPLPFVILSFITFALRRLP
jgi:hypothetical protein